jgi:hypothetical protein
MLHHAVADLSSDRDTATTSQQVKGHQGKCRSSMRASCITSAAEEAAWEHDLKQLELRYEDEGC